MRPGILRRVTAKTHHPATEEKPSAWRVELECGHVLAILDTHFSEKICGHYCPLCERYRDLRDELPTVPGPGAA